MSLTNEQVEKIQAKAEKAGFDSDEVCRILQVKAIADYRGNLGSALTKIEEARTSTATAVAVLPPGEIRGLYPSDELYALGQAARAFAPWANDDKYPFTDLEIALTVRRGDTLGLDVFNPHETQIWKDKRGNVNFQLAYTLMAGWANYILGGHTRPQYTDLTTDEKEENGIPAGDHACRCTFIMKSDLPLITTMIDAGWTAQAARDDLTLEGMATVSASDWASMYFAPNARSKRWKLEKRAYTDALRRRFGTPSQGAIEELRRATGMDSVVAADWKVAGEEGYMGDVAVKAAGMSAQTRASKEEIDEKTPEEVEAVLVKNRTILHGDEDDRDWDANESPAPARRVKVTERPSNERIEKLVFDPDNPDAPCEDWDGMFAAAVEKLGYNAIPHVKNTLRKGFPDGKGTVPDAWAYLVEHQAEKAKSEDTYPTRAEMLGQWTTLWDKAKVLGLVVTGIEPSEMSDDDISTVVDDLTIRIVAKESEIKDVPF